MSSDNWHDLETFTFIKLNKYNIEKCFGFKSSRRRLKRAVGQTANETVLRRTLTPQKYLPATSIPELLNIKGMLHEDALLVKCKAAGLVTKYFRGRGEAAEFLLIHIIYDLEDAVLTRKL